jgi:hypothetical protein
VDIRCVVWTRAHADEMEVEELDSKKRKTEEAEETEAGRIFVGTLQGEILEWGIAFSLQPTVRFRSPIGWLRVARRSRTQARTSSYGGAVWSLAADPAGARLVAACEDGSLRCVLCLAFPWRTRAWLTRAVQAVRRGAGRAHVCAHFSRAAGPRHGACLAP